MAELCDMHGAAGAHLGMVTPRTDSDATKPGSPMARFNLRLVCVFAVIDGMDIALLPASFRALEVTFGFSPGHLAALAAVQGAAQAVAAPFWGALADNGAPRKLLMALGGLFWAVLLFLLAWVTDFRAMLFLRGLNGLALGMFTPIVQSIVAQLSLPEERGSNFGRIELFRSIGNMGTMLVVTAISNEMILGMRGWRVAFLTVALSGAIFAYVILSLYQEEPRQWRPERVSLRSELSKVYGYWMIPTFRIISLQGMFKEIRMNALHFMTMYLQYLGLRDGEAGLVAATFVLFCGFGYMLGGAVGDEMAQWSPHHGRALTAQFSVLLSIPLLVLLFEAVPQEIELNSIIMCLAMSLGLVAMWPKTGCNKPILLEIVPSDSIASACAWDRCLENIVGMTIGPSIVGYLAETWYGYQPSELQVEDMDFFTRSTNSNALSRALLMSTVGPEIICFCFYCFLHYYYASDIVVEGRFGGIGKKDDRDGKLPTETTSLA